MPTNDPQDSLVSQIPVKVLKKVSALMVIETSFATGPGFCAGKVEEYPTPISFEQGMAWLERNRAYLKGGCMVFEDRSALWFAWNKYDRYASKPLKELPRPGIEAIDLTDPEDLYDFGLKRKGRFIVEDDESEQVFAEYTDEEMARIRARTSKAKKR